MTTPKSPDAGREHKLKTWPNHFAAISDGRKRFEWRRDDRGFEVGDTLLLEEWDPADRAYVYESLVSGRISSVRVRVTHILRGGFDIPHGYVVMSVEKTDAGESLCKNATYLCSGCGRRFCSSCYDRCPHCNTKAYSE